MNKAGVIPFQIQGDALAVLFVTSQTRGRWLLPKGRVRENENSSDTCDRVAHHEAGVRGVVLEGFPITIVVGNQTDDGLEQGPVTYYPLFVHSQQDEWPEHEKRKRHWVLIEDATKITLREDYRSLTQIICDMKPFLKTAVESYK